MQKFLPLLALSLGIATVSCDKQKKSQQSQGNLKSEWDSANAPQRIGLKSRDYEPNLAKLPTEGRLQEVPWSGDYWPTYKGGITYRWNHNSEEDSDRMYYPLKAMDSLTPDEIRQMSPAEKWDLFRGDKHYTLTERERSRTEILRTQSDTSFTIPQWEGLCHAWAPATHLYRNPGAVTLKGASGVDVPFGSSDIQALLTYHLHDSESKDTYFVSRRCNTDIEKVHKKFRRGEISHEEYVRIAESAECEGVNAGAFHIILTNMISKNQAFIVDVDRSIEVWNQAVHGFKTRQLSETTKIHPKSAPGTVREVLMETQMYYTVEISHTWDRAVTPDSEAVKDYKYWLEIDRAGNIVGGRWESFERPDFAWRQTLPDFEGYWKPLQRIYEASIADLPGAAPAPQDKTSHAGKFEVSMSVNDQTVFTVIKGKGKAPEGASFARFELLGTDGSSIRSFFLPLKDDGSFSFKTRVFGSMKDGKVIIRAFDHNKGLLAEESKELKASLLAGDPAPSAEAA